MSKIEGLTGIEVGARSVTIGAMAIHSAVANSPEVLQAIPSLASLAGSVGDPAVRHRGTIGGSIANNDPNARLSRGDALGLGATIITSKRRIAADDFFTGMFSTSLEPDEIITKLQFPDAEKGGIPENPAIRRHGFRHAGRRVRFRSGADSISMPWRSPVRARTACSA